MDLEDSAEEPRRPVTVLSGTLGAGKTTLVKHILREQHGYRIAVIQNEFSTEMGIEAPLITDASGDDFKDIYELPNGCLCCSAKDGLISLLDRLLEQRQRFDYVVVEATGTADPEALCEIFWVDEGLGSRVYLDGVVTLVDGRNALSALGDGGGDATGLGLEAEAAKQVACADILVLNKSDLLGEAQRQRTLARLTAMNATARVLESVYAAVPLGDILRIRAFDRDRLAESLASLALRASNPCGSCSGSNSIKESKFCGYGSTCGRAACGNCKELTPVPPQVMVADHGVESLLLRGEAAASIYDPEKVRGWIAEVLWEDTAGGIFRCKGLFRGPPEEDADIEGADEGEPMAYALQGVGKLFEIDAAPRVSAEQSKFLFIGRSLQREVLVDGLRSCLC